VTAERFTNLVSVQGVRNELLEPLMRDNHRANCSKNRTSES
jgi:hypothetical protein